MDTKLQIFIFQTNATTGRSKKYFTELLDAEIHKSKLQQPGQLSHLEKNGILKSFKRQSEHWGVTKAPGASNLATKSSRTRGKGSQILYRAIWLVGVWVSFPSVKKRCANFNNKNTNIYSIYTETIWCWRKAFENLSLKYYIGNQLHYRHI